MPIFKTTPEILTNLWDTGIDTPELPLKEDWLLNQSPMFDNINTWEQIYFQPGNIGVYAAWSPYVEIYIITYNLFLGTRYGIEVFKNSESVLERLREFNITLPVNSVWI